MVFKLQASSSIESEHSRYIVLLSTLPTIETQAHPWGKMRVGRGDFEVWPRDSYMREWTRSSLVQIMAYHLFGIIPLSKPILEYCHLDP